MVVSTPLDQNPISYMNVIGEKIIALTHRVEKTKYLLLLPILLVIKYHSLL